MLKIKIVILAFLFICLTRIANAQEIPSINERYLPIYDESDILDSTEEKQLCKKIISIEDGNFIQIQIVITDSLRNFTVEEVVHKWIESWDINNGILIFVAIADKKIRISVSNHLKGKLSESAALDIMKNTLNPGFLKNKYFESFDGALDEISKHLNGYYRGYGRYSRNYDHSLDFKWYEFHKYDLVSLIMLIVFALAFNIYVYLSYLSLPFGLNLLSQLFWHCLGSLNLFFYTILILKNMTITYESYLMHCILGFCQLLIFGFSFKYLGTLKFCFLNSIIFTIILLFSSSIFYLISSKEILNYYDFWPLMYCGLQAAVLFFIFIVFLKIYIKARLKRN